MNILIIEDEQPAAKQLVKMLSRLRPNCTINGPLESIEQAVKWFASAPPHDLTFMDIQLADGLSFEIFQQTKLNAPVIFTTAYDQYTLKAFKVNSVDYLLKPIDPEELEAALNKYDQLFNKKVQYNKELIGQLLQTFLQKEYKERFIVKAGQQLTFVKTSDIHYFYSEDGMVFAKTGDKKRHIIDYTLEQLADQVDPAYFFRINRSLIIRLEAIRKIHTYFNSRLKLDLTPTPGFDVIVSRDRVPDFKEWLDR